MLDPAIATFLSRRPRDEAALAGAIDGVFEGLVVMKRSGLIQVRG